MDSEKRAKHVAECQSAAMQDGLIGAAKALAVTAPVLAAALHFSPAFKRATGTSTRTGLLMSPFFLMFWLRSEQSISACARRNLDLRTALAAK